MSLATLFKTRRLIGRAKRLRQGCERSADCDSVVNSVRQERKFSLVQKNEEIIDFVRFVERLKPGVVVDIGSSGGGTIRLFSHFATEDARILSIDLQNSPMRQAAFKYLIRPRQSITVYQGSSYAPETALFLKEWLKGEKIDLLFVDGDHEYEGVSGDFSVYSPFMRKGGLIGFHDIVEDFKTRYGQQTASYVGGVPRFWKEIKQKYPNVKEIIKDPSQDGFGIGVIEW